jgi:hypothetical protein
MRGYVRCERCDWSRIYARFSVARIPTFCPACGRRVVRERDPKPDSVAVARWRAVADQLAHREAQPPDQQAGGPRPAP